MNLLLRDGPRKGLHSFTTYQGLEGGAEGTCPVTADGSLLEYETLELRVHPPNVKVRGGGGGGAQGLECGGAWIGASPCCAPPSAAVACIGVWRLAASGMARLSTPNANPSPINTLSGGQRVLR